MVRIFDEQIFRICDLIDAQLDLIKTNQVCEAVPYLILSGGLGSSPYVRGRLKDRYERRSLNGRDDTQHVSVLLAGEP